MLNANDQSFDSFFAEKPQFIIIYSLKIHKKKIIISYERFHSVCVMTDPMGFLFDYNRVTKQMCT